MKVGCNMIFVATKGSIAFHKIEDVFQQAAEAMPRLENELERLGFSADDKPSVTS